MFISSIIKDAPNVTTPGFESTNEMDSHADTCCLGSNWKLLYLTNDVVDVTPFSDRYDAMCDVPIGGGATYIQLPSGEEYVLVIHQALWFGDQLPISLLNPNQLRSHSVQVWDNPCDVSKPMSICDPISTVKIPLEMMGTFCTFPSRVPTDDDLKNLPRIQLTSTSPWNPADAVFYPHQLDEGSMMDVE